MIQVWGRRSSGNVIKVIWCLRELDLPFHVWEVGGRFGQTKERWFLELNPNGLVPVFHDDDGYVVWESNAIVRYVAAKYAMGTLWPDECRARADADRWMDWPLLVQPHMTNLAAGLVRSPEQRRDAVQLKEARQAAVAIWATLNEHLVGREFVAGKNFTMGDIAIGHLAHRWFNLDIDPPEMRALSRWYERLTERPAFQAEIMNACARPAKAGPAFRTSRVDRSFDVPRARGLEQSAFDGL
ncbi:glutathione S-transferase family protein [Bradyrhizobium sp. LTSP885]|uniref:glutathione S-transferase family protein n=1 Tax=Bradyrhizobium sp. LTSP885 TaxID=1619232 RepID=UPI0007C77C7C|nr:glutathione S-transferase family protein [Bradyrhizobium sp. LTSP885]